MGQRDVVRITSAPTSRADDLGARQRRYMFSMAIRMICVVAAVVVGPGPLRWVALLGAVFLPYVAVVMANANESRSEKFEVPGVDAQHVLGERKEP
ncbi:MAG: DUF3099 domain-containing protein [Nocardioides sp.]|uniref:DUF3099 domain-containing protein n=1 Tax=Nocardioides sp. TaxID=35761 RepID=UPI003EFC471D